MEFQEKQEKDILTQMKEIADRVGKAQSIAGLLVYQADIQRFYENFILAKKLNESKEWRKFANDKNEDATTNVDTVVQEDPKMEENVQKILQNTEDVNTKEQQTEELSSPIEEAVPKEQIVNMENPTTADSNGKQNKIDYNFSIQAGKKYNPLKLDLNDNIAFLKFLFENDKVEYDHFLENLNARNQITSVTYIEHYITKMNWTQTQEEYVQRLVDLNAKRFD